MFLPFTGYFMVVFSFSFCASQALSICFTEGLLLLCLAKGTWLSVKFLRPFLRESSDVQNRYETFLQVNDANGPGGHFETLRIFDLCLWVVSSKFPPQTSVCVGDCLTLATEVG